MYDPRETELSREYAIRLFQAVPGLVMLGGWAVHLMIGDEYRRATGREYLRSRDIDVFVPEAEAGNLRATLEEFGMRPGAYRFRYSLQLGREDGRRLDEGLASRTPMYDIVSIDLDIFADGAYWKGAWLVPRNVSKGIMSGETRRLSDQTMRVPGASTLLGMKCDAYEQRESEGKREKDACDIYALMRFGGLGGDKKGSQAVTRMLDSQHPRLVARQLFADEGVEGLIRRDLRRWSEQVRRSGAGA